MGIRCYGDPEECGFCREGVCEVFECGCAEIRIGPDGSEEDGRRWRYYFRSVPPTSEELPEGMTRMERHYGPEYAPEVDGLVWGWAEFDRRLKPWEVARYGLISAPVDGAND